jgi:hypothetical protein
MRSFLNAINGILILRSAQWARLEGRNMPLAAQAEQGHGIHLHALAMLADGQPV